MKFTFKDIINPQIYETGYVIFVTGQYNIFNNIVIDQFKDDCVVEDDYQLDKSTLSEFGITEQSNKVIVSNSVDLATFFNVIDIPSINGKWFCRTDLTVMSKKQIEQVEKYMRNPSKNGILVVTINEYRDYRTYLFNKVLCNSQHSHIIQLSFPSKSVLIPLVQKLFELREVQISEPAAQLFIMRMSTAYDDYDTIIDKLCLGLKDVTLSYDDVFEGLKGIDNYVIEDFIETVVKPIKSDKVATNRNVYKMYKMLVNEYGAVDFVHKLRHEISELIDFRIVINRGIIPIKVHFSVPEAKDKLGEDNKLAKMSDYKFRKMANVASLTSLEDWVYMKLILSNVACIASRKSVKIIKDSDGNEKKIETVTEVLDESSCEKALYALMHRTVFNESRLNNDIGIENEVIKPLNGLDSIIYDENNLMFSNKDKEMA